MNPYEQDEWYENEWYENEYNDDDWDDDDYPIFCFNCGAPIQFDQRFCDCGVDFTDDWGIDDGAGVI